VVVSDAVPELEREPAWLPEDVTLVVKLPLSVALGVWVSDGVDEAEDVAVVDGVVYPVGLCVDDGVLEGLLVPVALLLPVWVPLRDPDGVPVSDRLLVELGVSVEDGVVVGLVVVAWLGLPEAVGLCVADGVAVGVGVSLWLLLNKTKLGLMIRAGVDDREMLSACGVNLPMVAIAVFALGAALAGLGGVIGSTAQPLSQGMDGRFLLIALVVVIVGGMGSITGTALGAVMIGIAEQVGQALFPTYSVILTFVIMVAVLALRPQGLLGRATP
jgi:predicted ABC-type sugar transport system permease subunit